MQLTLELPVVNPYAAPQILRIMTRETPAGCRRTRLMKPEVLAKILNSAPNGQEKLLLVDSRSFMEYNVDHIQRAVNVTGSKLVKRRLQHNKLSIVILHCSLPGKGRREGAEGVQRGCEGATKPVLVDLWWVLREGPLTPQTLLQRVSKGWWLGTGEDAVIRASL